MMIDNDLISKIKECCIFNVNIIKKISSIIIFVLDIDLPIPSMT